MVGQWTLFTHMLACLLASPALLGIHPTAHTPFCAGVSASSRVFPSHTSRIRTVLRLEQEE